MFKLQPCHWQCVYASATNWVRYQIANMRSRLRPVGLETFNQNSQQRRRPDVFLQTSFDRHQNCVRCTLYVYTDRRYEISTTPKLVCQIMCINWSLFPEIAFMDFTDIDWLYCCLISRNYTTVNFFYFFYRMLAQQQHYVKMWLITVLWFDSAIIIS